MKKITIVGLIGLILLLLDFRYKGKVYEYLPTEAQKQISKYIH